MNKEIDSVLEAYGLQPVLLDIGASGGPPSVWAPIAHRSTYIGFDPDRRDLADVRDGQYARSIIVNEAVTSAQKQTDVNFYLTHSPHCSSTLPPDTKALADYLFSDLFAVEREVSVRASSLGAVLDRLDLPGVDWFKTDSQGTDLRLFQSLPGEAQKKVFAVDIEPGLIDAYKGEDLFVNAHASLLDSGFWLSSLDVKGSVRMKRTTLERVAGRRPRLRDADIYRSVGPSPGWCEARYLRTLESLEDRNALERDYALLWVFAVIERQWGFALDIAGVFEERFASDGTPAVLVDLPLRMVTGRDWKLRSIARELLPPRAKRLIGRLVK